MKNASLSPAKERILLDLKTKGPRTVSQLAKRLGVTPMAVRQHLAALEDESLVVFEEERGKVGRPLRRWKLADTDAALARFPDSHADLTLDLLQAAHATFGADGMERLVARRTRGQLARYREAMGDAELEKRIAVLARLRRDEGYMAEWSRKPDGSYLFIENHCPICAAAEACQGLCRGELELFGKALGKGVRVERLEHILVGARRCAYRIEAS